MIDRSRLNEKFGHMNNRFDARFGFMLAIRGVRFDKETGFFYHQGIRQPIFGREFVMHADDDVFADRIDGFAHDIKD
jgi:hypothetical protein